ncbi:MAG TPA: helicase-related protein [Chryseolinea sp.]|nr:helicase-related protein [Chryseolinea sp.]
MSRFKEKRDSLESFLNEQVLGPGAFNKRFFFLKDWNTNEFAGKNLHDCKAIANIREVIAEVPAYQYSSGILFPISNNPVDEVSQSEVVQESSSDEPEEEHEPKADDEQFRDDHTESVSSKNQNYPNTCGIAFAFASNCRPDEHIRIMIRLRTYGKVKQERCRFSRLGYWISENAQDVMRIITTYFSGIFEIESVDGNVFVCLANDVDISHIIYAIDYKNLEMFVASEVVPMIDKHFPDGRFYKFDSKKYDEEYRFHRIYVDSLIDEVNSSIAAELASYDNWSKFIYTLELYSQVKEIITTLKTIYRAGSKTNQPTPIWESIPFEKPINLPPLDEKRDVTRGEICIDEAMKMYLNFQYIRYRGEKYRSNIYVKLVLVNRNEIQLKLGEPPQLNKKDKANEVAYFGVQMTAIETRPGTFVPYNPPNLLDIDQELNFTKLLYRQYKDYGEGYNTSVDWGEDTTGLKWVGAQFLPSQEVPRVDFNPKKVVGSRITALIDEDVLSIRRQSTFSDSSDKDVIELLTSLVSKYGAWIEDRSKDLLESSLDQDERSVLARQLNSCTQDHKRLQRNVRLLRDNVVAMAAYRTMSSAMLMQLHHGKMIKQGSKDGSLPFVSGDNSEQYYREIDNSAYLWRSFQLAFILLNIDAFVRPPTNDSVVDDVFKTGWPERNEIADLVWFPTGGGKTEAYLGIIGFAIAYRRFMNTQNGHGTAVLMRYTLRLLTLQQFQRATLLICALEVIRKEQFLLPSRNTLGSHRITIGLFVGGDSTPNRWGDEGGMQEELSKIAGAILREEPVLTRLPHTECPWCGGRLFVDSDLSNVHPNPLEDSYGIKSKLLISCNVRGCAFYEPHLVNEDNTIPIRLFDDDIYKFPPTLLFGTVDKFAALANKVSTVVGNRDEDSRRLFGSGVNYSTLPPELIIQDELHLLSGPLGSAVGLFERAIDHLCSYEIVAGVVVKPKVITSTATTRNTDSQIFALFNRRSEIFPKQGLSCDDSFFASFERDSDSKEYKSNRKYVGLLPIGKTQVWMQLRVASICLAHRIKYVKAAVTADEVFHLSTGYEQIARVMDYYHTILAYFNSLKEVGKTESQLTHYLPGDVALVMRNTMPWSYMGGAISRNDSIESSELTGRLTGQEVKTNLSRIERSWDILKPNSPPEFVISTSMISVGIDVPRLNTMIINSMPRNTAEYIQASSRVARESEGIVFTVHHPFKSRDLSHYQRFKEFHEKFYGYVEPISVTPYAFKALERYFAMYVAVVVRHRSQLRLSNNNDARAITEPAVNVIFSSIMAEIEIVRRNSYALKIYLKNRAHGPGIDMEEVLGEEELNNIAVKLRELLYDRWVLRIADQGPAPVLSYRTDKSVESLFDPTIGSASHMNWNVKQSLREIAPSVVVKTVQQ